MRKETRELFETLKDAKTYSYLLDAGTIINKVKCLEETLIDVESIAQNGGFIRDSEGNVCRNGDKVKCEISDAEITGILRWEAASGLFTVCGGMITDCDSFVLIPDKN